MLKKRKFIYIYISCFIINSICFSPDILPNILQSHLEQNHTLVHIYDSDEIKKQDSKPTEEEHAIFQANLALRQLVLQSLKTNRKTLNIGGDHTMGLGTVSAFLECFKDKEKMVILRLVQSRE